MSEQKKPWNQDWSNQQNVSQEAKPWEREWNNTAPSKQQGRGVLGHIRDTGLSALKGAIALPEAAVGLADIPTGGQVGKFLENKDGAIGFRPAEARKSLSELHTDQYKKQQEDFSNADGVIAKTKQAIKNPSMIVNTVAESIPSMIGGAGIARGALAAAPKIGALAAGALGEGAIMAGAQASNIRDQTEDRLLTAEQSGASIATGALGSLFGYAGGKIASKYGFGDVDTLMASGRASQRQTANEIAGEIASAPAKSIPRKVIEGAITEGFLEELPQSVSEQILQNLALNKEWSDGVADAAVMGTLAGMAMGAGAGSFGGGSKGNDITAPPVADDEAPNAPINPNDINDIGGNELPQDSASTNQQGADTAPADTAPADLSAPIEPPNAVNTNSDPSQSLDNAQPDGTQVPVDQQQSEVQPEMPAEVTTPNAAMANFDPTSALSMLAEAKRRKDAERNQSSQAPVAPKPSEQMGLNPDNGPMSAAAALAVDSGVAPSVNPTTGMPLLGSPESTLSDAAALASGEQQAKPTNEQYQSKLGELDQQRSQFEQAGDYDSATKIYDQMQQLSREWQTSAPKTDETPKADYKKTESDAAWTDYYNTNRNNIGDDLFTGGYEDRLALESAPEDLRLRSAHGMAKSSSGNAISDLKDLLNNGIDPNRGDGRLFTAPLSNVFANEEDRQAASVSGTSSGSAYSDGAFTLVAKNGVGDIRNMSEVDAVMVNSSVPNAVVEGLRKDFPSMKFGYAGELPTLLGSNAPAQQDGVGIAEPTNAKADPVLGADGKNKWFSTQDRADSFIAKKGLAATHEVAKAGNRFEITPKTVATSTDASTIDNAAAQPETGKPKAAVSPVAAPTTAIATLEVQLANTASVAAKAKIRKEINALKKDNSIDRDAHAAATSTKNDLPTPTQAQIEAGNYKKGHIKVHGLDIAIENPRGSERSGTDPDGKSWSHTMSDHYGYIKRTTGADQEQIDAYVGKNPESNKVYVVDQIDQATGGFDEHKVMLGFDNQEDAIAAYQSNFDEGWKVGSVNEMSKEQFKDWLKNSNTSKPVLEGQNTAQQQGASSTSKQDAGTPKTTEVTTDLGLIHNIPSKLMNTSHKLGDVVKDLAAITTTGAEVDNKYAKDLLATIAKLNPDVQVHIVSDLNNIKDKAVRSNLAAGGFYVPEENTAYLYPKSEEWLGSALELVNHELVHSVTERSITNGLVSEENLNQLNMLIGKVKGYLFDGYRNLSDNVNDRLDYATTTNPTDEFLASGIAETEVREALNNIIGVDGLQQLDAIFTEISTKQAKQNDSRNKGANTGNSQERMSRVLPDAQQDTAAAVQGLPAEATGSQDNTRSKRPDASDIPTDQEESGKVAKPDDKLYSRKAVNQKAGLSVKAARTALVKRFGEVVIAKLERDGKLRIVEQLSNLPSDALNSILAFHGSPFKFEKFSLEHLGRGDGQQLYGHGLYFSDSKAVSEFYRKNLAKRGDSGQLYQVNINSESKDILQWEEPLSDQQEILSRLKPLQDHLTGLGVLEQYETMLGREFNDWNGGELYTVLKHAAKNDVLPQDNLDLIEAVEMGRHQKAASLYLNQLGINGLKYSQGNLDGTKSTGDSNYVIFDDSAIEIVDTFYSQNSTGIEGYCHNGEVVLIASNLTDDTVIPTFLHELGGHAGFQNMMQPKQYAELMRQFDRMVKQGNPIALEAQKLAMRESNTGTQQLEMLPYLLSLASNPNVKNAIHKSAIKRFIADLISKVKAWVFDKLGVNLTLTPNDMVALAERMVKQAANGNGAATSNGDSDTSNPDVLFSRGFADNINDLVNNLNKQGLKKVKGRVANSMQDWLDAGLALLGRRQLVDIYSSLLPQLAKYNQLAAQMDADQNDAGAKADNIVRAWSKLKDEQALAELMHDATLAQIDPAKPRVKTDNVQKYLALKNAYDKLTPEAKEIYLKARDAYKDHYNAVHGAIKERILRSELSSQKKADLMKQMDANFFGGLKGVYFPLARFGKYTVIVRDANGDVQSVSRAETKNEAVKTRNELIKLFPNSEVSEVILEAKFQSKNDSVSRGFMAELFNEVDNLGLSSKDKADFEDTLNQLYLSSLPDLSWAKHGIHRKGTPGFSQNARRAFAQNMFHGASYLSKVRYADQLADELDGMKKYADANKNDKAYKQNIAQAVIDEMNARHENMMNPKSSSVSSALTSLGFVYFLGLSPASAIVNIMQTPLVAFPVLGTKWGFDKASSALLKASSDYVAGVDVNGKTLNISKNFTANEKLAYDKAVAAGVIDVTQAHDLAGIAQGEDSGVMWKTRPIMRAASFMFHHAERFNREVTFIAAFRLATQAGAATDLAYKQAVDATYKGHFDYSAGNRPRFMQGNVAKVLFLFKQFGQNMIYTIARETYQSFAAKTQAEKVEARRTIGSLLAMHAVAAGVLGLPLVTTLLALVSMMGGGDDEPWDAEVALRNYFADTIGVDAANVLMKGASRATPVDISGRVGLDHLVFPSIQSGLEGARWWESILTAAAGPIGGIGTNVAKGAQEMGDGRYMEGLEQMLPVSLKSPLKSYRYATEGVQDRTGISVMDEVSAMGVTSQAFGFSPSDVRTKMEGKSAIYQDNKRLEVRRKELMAKWTRAMRAEDNAALDKAWEAIDKFNSINPDRTITPKNLTQSYRGTDNRIARAENGVYLAPSKRGSQQAGRFAFDDSGE